MAHENDLKELADCVLLEIEQFAADRQLAEIVQDHDEAKQVMISFLFLMHEKRGEDFIRLKRMSRATISLMTCTNMPIV